jgi:hypothetical protein
VKFNKMLAFNEEDFEILSQADEDPCESCLYCYNNGQKVTQPQSFDYRRLLENTFEKRFRTLSDHIRIFMLNEFGFNLSYKFEPPSVSGYKIRPFCYMIFSRDVGGGQITAQLNFRLSNDSRSGDTERTKKIGVKFSLHDKCSEKLENEDIENFSENVMNPNMQERLLKYVKSLHEDFYVYKSLGRCNGIERVVRAKDIQGTADLEHTLLARENDEILFQEIFRAYNWKNHENKEIIGNMNKLSMAVLNDFVSLYPIYLFAVIRGQSSLLNELDKYDDLLEKNRLALKHLELHLLEQPQPYILNKGDPEDKFSEIFGGYVCDACSMEIREPWMESPKQRKNLMRVLNLVKVPKNCEVTLITKNKMQNNFLKDIKKTSEKRGFGFKYEFENIHNRWIKTEYWMINLPKGLHMFRNRKAEDYTEITYTPQKKYKLV